MQWPLGMTGFRTQIVFTGLLFPSLPHPSSHKLLMYREQDGNQQTQVGESFE